MRQGQSSNQPTKPTNADQSAFRCCMAHAPTALITAHPVWATTRLPPLLAEPIVLGCQGKWLVVVLSSDSWHGIRRFVLSRLLLHVATCCCPACRPGWCPILRLAITHSVSCSAWFAVMCVLGWWVVVFVAPSSSLLHGLRDALLIAVRGWCSRVGTSLVLKKVTEINS